VLLINRIKNGKEGAMPAFVGAFESREIEAIVAYLHSFEGLRQALLRRDTEDERRAPVVTSAFTTARRVSTQIGEDISMRKSFIVALMAAGILALTDRVSWAEDEAQDAAALAKALGQASVTLQQGLKASQQEGSPISGKYELENGVLQLSVYAMKGNQFLEVIVDHKSGTIKKAGTISDADDLKAAQEQGQVMAKAKASLDEAVEAAVKEASCCYRGNYRAVSVVPILKADQPVADITLMSGKEVKKVAQKLD
jgi:hypothetical protein